MSFLEEDSFNLNKPLPGKIRDYDLVLPPARKRAAPAAERLGGSARQQRGDNGGSRQDPAEAMDGGLIGGDPYIAGFELHDESIELNSTQQARPTEQARRRQREEEKWGDARPEIVDGMLETQKQQCKLSNDIQKAELDIFDAYISAHKADCTTCGMSGCLQVETATVHIMAIYCVHTIQVPIWSCPMYVFLFSCCLAVYYIFNCHGEVTGFFPHSGFLAGAQPKTILLEGFQYLLGVWDASQGPQFW